MSTPEDTDCEDMTKPGRISWAELNTSDADAAIAFYTQMFGWTTQPFGEDYVMFVRGETPFAGMVKTPKPGVPTHWLNYVVVADVEASIAQTTSLGGTHCMGPMDIPTVGRIAIVQDPQGAVIGLHQCL